MNLFAPKTQANTEQIREIQLWVRTGLRLDDETVVMVSELRCSEPGCPPIETMIAVMDGPGRRRQFKFHKSIAEMTEQDVESAILRE